MVGPTAKRGRVTVMSPQSAEVSEGWSRVLLKSLHRESKPWEPGR